MQTQSHATVIMSMRNQLRSELPFALLLLVAVGASASSVEAQRWAKQPDGEWHEVEEPRELPPVLGQDSKVRIFGVTLLAGVPEGIAPGISIHPGTNLLHFDLSVTSVLSFGARAGVTFDPFDWVLAPTLTVAAGYSAWAKIPSTTTRYELYYMNIQPGIEFGRRSRFRLFARAGYSHLWAFSQSPSTFEGLRTATQPSVRIHLFPSVILGLTGYFGQ